MAYLYDCHVHTAEVSWYGMVPAAEMVHLYKIAGYTGIVITDHYFKEYFEAMPDDWTWEQKIEHYLGGYKQAWEAGQKIGLEVLLGMELRFHNRIEDYLVYGITPEFLVEHPHLYEHTVESFIHFSREHDLMIIQAHPFRTGQEPAPADCLDGVEVYNGNSGHDSRNHLALDYAEKHGLIQVSGSDAHRVVEVGAGGIWIDKVVHTSMELADYLRQHPVPKRKAA